MPVPVTPSTRSGSSSSSSPPPQTPSTPPPESPVFVALPKTWPVNHVAGLAVGLALLVGGIVGVSVYFITQAEDNEPEEVYVPLPCSNGMVPNISDNITGLQIGLLNLTGIQLSVQWRGLEGITPIGDQKDFDIESNELGYALAYTDPEFGLNNASLFVMGDFGAKAVEVLMARPGNWEGQDPNFMEINVRALEDREPFQYTFTPCAQAAGDSGAKFWIEFSPLS